MMASISGTCVVALVCVGASMPALAADWKPFALIPNGCTAYLDHDSIVIGATTRMAWTRTVFVSGVECEGKSVQTIVALKEVHCSNNEIRVLKEFGYLENGESAYTIDSDPAAKAFSPVIPASFGESFLLEVCRWKPSEAKLIECVGPAAGGIRGRNEAGAACGDPVVPATPVR